MDKSLRVTFVNSTLAYIAAFFATTFLHELGHFIAYGAAGAGPVLYHNCVEASGDGLSLAARLTAVLAGPAVGLLLGCASGFMVLKRRGTAAGDLFLLWLALFGFINAGGYLMLTPFSTAGDTGKAAEMLGLGTGYRIMAAVVGVALLFLAVGLLARRFASFTPDGRPRRDKAASVYAVMFFPIIAGSATQTLFALPAPVALSLVYPATSSLFIMGFFGLIMRSPGATESVSPSGRKISRPLVLAALGSAALNRILTLGVRWPW